MVFIKSSTKILMEKNLKKFKIESTNSLKTVRKYHDLAEAFVAFVETRGFFMNSIKNDDSVSLHSDILADFFGGRNIASKIVNILFEIKALNFKESVHSTFYSISRTFLPRYTKTYHFTNIKRPELSDRIEKAVSKYFEEHRKPLPEEYKQLEKDFYTMFVDFKEADSTMKAKYGISYFEMKYLVSNTDSVNFDNKTMVAYCAYMNLNKIHNKNYHMLVRYGRVYTPFHSLPRELRSSLRSHNKSVSEILDIHATFVRFSASIAEQYFKQTGDNEGVNEIRKMIDVLETSDFYSDIDVFNVGRSVIKKTILSICFSSSSNKKWKYMMTNRIHDRLSIAETSVLNNLVKKMNHGKYENISKAEKKILNKSITSLLDTHIDLNKIGCFADFDKDTFAKVSKLSYYSSSILFTKVLDSLQTKYPKFTEFLYTFDSMCSVESKKYSNEIKEAVKDSNKVPLALHWSKSELPAMNSLNLSTECQRLESEVFIKTILPVLKNKHPEETFVSLHDAVFSTASNIDTDSLKKKLYEEIDRVASGYSFEALKTRLAC